MHKKGGKKCKKDTTQQRINYSKTIITLPDRFLKYKALVKTIRIGQVTVNIKRLGKHELTWQVLFLEENRQQFTQTLSYTRGQRLHVLFEKSSMDWSTSHAPSVAVYKGFPLEQRPLGLPEKSTPCGWRSEALGPRPLHPHPKTGHRASLPHTDLGGHPTTELGGKCLPSEKRFLWTQWAFIRHPTLSIQHHILFLGALKTPPWAWLSIWVI